MNEAGEDRLQALHDICRAQGIPLTHQRRAVLQVLLQRSDHPTADQVFEAVQLHSPQISRRTVYRVLDTLVELGLNRRVHHPGATARFDAMIHRHHHLVCTTCHKIVDLDSPALDKISLPKGRPHGFDVSDFSVQLIGTCPDCRKDRRT